MAVRRITSKDISLQMEDWRMRVTITEVFPPKKQDEHTLQKFVFTDEEGQQIEGIIWGAFNINHMCDKMQLYNVLDLGVERIQIIEKEEYRLTNNMHQLVITPRDYCNKIEGAQPFAQSLLENITAFEDLIPHIATEQLINILAVVIDNGELIDTWNEGRKGKGRTLRVITEEGKPLKLTLWDSYAVFHSQALDKVKRDYPAIIGKRLRIGEFNDMSLYTKADQSSIAISLPLQEAFALKAWFIANRGNLAAVIQDTTTNPYTFQLIQTGAKKMNTLDDIRTATANGQYLAQVKMECLEEEKLYYVGCKICYVSKKSAIPGEECDCFKCGKKTPLVARALVKVQLTDDTTTLTVAAIGPLAEQLLGMTGEELYTMKRERKRFDMRTVNEKIRDKSYHVVIIKSISKTTYQGKRQTRMSLSSITESVALLTAPEPRLAIEAKPTTEEDETDIATTPPTKMETKQMPTSSTTPAEETEKVPAPEATNKKEIQVEKSARRSLEMQLAQEEQQFSKKIKAELASPSDKSTQ